MKLNLEAQNKAEEVLLQYLEENASEVLAGKIHNGVQIQKDGKTLLNKKTLQTFMAFATAEASKLSNKKVGSVCYGEDIVFGWLMHYFEEDTIEGELFNLDGSKYEAPKPAVTQPPKITKPVKEKPQDTQMSIFDTLLEQQPQQEQPLVIPKEITPLEPVVQDAQRVEQAVAEIQRNAQKLQAMDEQPDEHKPKLQPFYKTYLQIQEKYPQAIIAFRLGDFYEVLGDNAVKVGNAADLTITSKRIDDNDNRVPLVGFPYHAAEKYFDTIAQKFTLVIAESASEVHVYDKKLTVKNNDSELTDVEIFEQEEDIYDEIDNLTVQELDEIDRVTQDGYSVDENGEVVDEQYKFIKELSALVGVKIIVW